MKICVLHPYPVFSGGVGGVTRVNSLVRFLAPRHDVTVFAHSSGCRATDDEAIRDLESLGIEQLIFDPGRPGVGRRLGWAVSRVPYFVAYNRNPGLEAALSARDRNDNLDVVHVELAYMAPLLERLGRRPVRILAEQETMSMVVERLRRVPLWKRTPYESFLVSQASKIRRFEAGALASFDRLYAITPEEAETMTRVSGRSVEILPHVVNTTRFALGEFENRQPTVLFVGNYRHRPNLVGLLWFVEKVWPEVAASHPEAIFEVVGPCLADSLRRRFESTGIRVSGRVEDLASRYQSASVFVNPILSGGGMRGKVLESFACGLPVVSTRMGMEGISAEPEIHCLLADDTSSFIRQVNKYLSDPGLRETHGAAARRLIESTYDDLGVFRRLEEDYRNCVRKRGGQTPP